MSAAVKLTRTDRTAAELRALAAKCRDAAQARRLLAIAMVLEGASRLDAARQAGMDRQTLCDWVHRYNDTGVDGLKSRTAPGAKPSLALGAPSGSDSDYGGEALQPANAARVFRGVHVSGAKTDRAQLRRVIETLHPGDVLTARRARRAA